MPTISPRLPGTYEDAARDVKSTESVIAMIDMYIRTLSIEKEQLMRRRISSVLQVQQYEMSHSSMGKLPVSKLAQFLSSSELSKLSSTSRHFRDQCFSDNQLLLVHLTTPKAELSYFEAESFVSRICLPMVESLSIDAKRPAGKNLIKALSTKGSLMTSLASVRISAAAESGELIDSLNTFMGSVACNQITCVHVSGLRALKHLAPLIANQTDSIENFKVDYFVNGHEKDMTEFNFPLLPKLKSFVYDVADVVNLPIDLVLNRLKAVSHKSQVQVIYLPHMQISGDSGKVLELISLLKQFVNVRQMVVRFRHLPLSVKEIVALREAFYSLPAVCISDHFIVMLDSWASWWPNQSSIWDRPEKITGLSVFREQIDFESLGTTAQREWLKLTAEQKNLWSKKIASSVLTLYMKQYSPHTSTAVIRSASV